MCRVGAQATRLLTVMLRLADETSWRSNRLLLSWPSTAEIRCEAGLSHKQISLAPQELLAAGLIARAPGYKRGGCDPVALYRINRTVRDTGEARAG